MFATDDDDDDDDGATWMRQKVNLSERREEKIQRERVRIETEIT